MASVVSRPGPEAVLGMTCGIAIRTGASEPNVLAEARGS